MIHDDAKWTPDCPHPDELLDLATQGPSSVDARRLIEHVRDCAYCTRVYADTLSALQIQPAPAPWTGRGGADRVDASTSSDPELRRYRGAQAQTRSHSAFWGFAGFAAGAAAVTGLLYLTIVPSLKARGENLGNQLTASKNAESRQADEVRRLSVELTKSQAAAKPPVSMTTTSGDSGELEEALLTGHLKVPAEVLSFASLVRGAERTQHGSIRLNSPRNTFVLSSRPVLSADPEPGVADFKAFLTDADGNEVPLAQKSPNSWQPNTDLRPMHAYQWAVEGQKSGERVRSAVAVFQLVDSKSADAMAAARKRYAGRPLMQAVLLAKAGLLEEAESTLRDVLRSHPKNAAASGLLRDLERQRKGGE